MTNENPYSRLLGWEVENFMSIEKAKVEFDDKNIINFKGYNDSGKSAMLTALKVLFCNSNPTKQVGFIQDGKDYFRVIATFSDGVQILRDKYINGQSLYEMYKDSQCIFSTKNGRTLGRVTEVPKPIADYLGLIMYDDVCLNSRSCFEKQIGVQTTGSENYKMFNTVLKSEEIARATDLINTDKNKLVADISAVSSQIDANKGILGKGAFITSDMIDYLKEHDNLLDLSSLKTKALSTVVQLNTTISGTVIPPEIPELDNKRLVALSHIQDLFADIQGISLSPELPVISDTQFSSLNHIQDLFSQINSISVAPEIPEVSNTQLDCLMGIIALLNKVSEIDTEIVEADARATQLEVEINNLLDDLKSFGVKLVRCPDCGCMFDPSTHHAD